jgi:hypothetical protein
MAKAVLHLAGLRLAIELTQRGDQERFLLGMWEQAMALVSAVGGAPPREILARTGELLDATRGRNPARAEDARYTERAREPGKYRELAAAFTELAGV